ncbi:MAG TPA: acyl-CoA dehydrogenase family protein [Stellaceae bacterium]|nr:acyl-CoA dehydrogenase family protein [Stellaceae bacterium]
MDFDYSDEQRLLDETVRRLVKDEYEFAQRKKYLAEAQGFSAALWAKYAELGLLGLPFAEEYGGFGGGGIETMIVMEAFGRGLAVEPYLATVVLGGGLVALAGSDGQKSAILPEIAAGNLKLAFAQGERRSRYDLAHVETGAKAQGGGFVLDGHKTIVPHGGAAHKFIVAARTAGAATDKNGISLFLVDRDAKGVAVRDYPTVDGQRAADVSLSNVAVGADALLGPRDGALPIIVRVVDRALAALCAEAVGIMETLNAMTLDYIKTRKQFGVPIGSFQVLQHRMVDMTIAAEQAKSLEILAAMSADSDDDKERGRAISAAKVQIGLSGRAVGQGAIQLHGGIGMTDEYAAGHYFKRLTTIEHTFGDTDYHLDRFPAFA